MRLDPKGEFTRQQTKLGRSLRSIASPQKWMESQLCWSERLLWGRGDTPRSSSLLGKLV